MRGNPAANFNRIRRILYSTIHQPEKGIPYALDYLEGYRKSLGPKGYTGLKAEINFYIKNIKRFNLIVAGDMGDHTDFAATIDRKPFRIDVTTNLKYKDLKNYEPLQKSSGTKYKIILTDNEGEIDEILDINFPFCNSCNEGRLIDVGVLLPESESTIYAPEYDTAYTQKHVGICSSCGYIKDYQESVSPYLPTFNEECSFYSQQISSYNQTIDIDREYLDYDEFRVIKAHALEFLPYLESTFEKKIMALADYNIYRDKTIVEVKWRKNIPLLRNYIKTENVLL